MVDPKQISVISKNEKQKKKKFLCPFSCFFPHPFALTIFLLLFCVLIASLFPVGQQKFPGEKSKPIPPPPPPGCYATEYII